MTTQVLRLIRRIVFGLLALFACLGFATFAGVLLFVQPAGMGKQVFRHVLIDGFGVVAIFMLLAALQSFSYAPRWVTHLIDRLTPKACFVIFVFAIGMYAFATAVMVFG